MREGIAHQVDPGEAAIVTVDDLTRLSLLVPRLTGGHAKEVPRALLYLTAVMVRFEKDPDFVEEQINWFRGGRLD